MSIEKNRSFEKTSISPIADSLQERNERLDKWSKWHIRASLGALGISAVSTVGVPVAFILQERNPWTDFFAFSAGLATTSVIAYSIPIIDNYLNRIIKHLTPEELKLYKAELKRFDQSPEKPGESFAIKEPPKPPSLPPSPASVFSPIKPGPGGLSAAAEKEIEKEPELVSAISKDKGFYGVEMKYPRR